MTPEEKAKELVNKFYKHHSQPHYQDAVAFGRIAVLEIEKAIDLANAKNCTELVQVYQYWQSVKSEIEKL